jgi:hypothetical protein
MVAAKIANIKLGDNQHTMSREGRSIDLPFPRSVNVAQREAGDR